jgi:hypothetical protein
MMMYKTYNIIGVCKLMSDSASIALSVREREGEGGRGQT